LVRSGAGCCGQATALPNPVRFTFEDDITTIAAAGITNGCNQTGTRYCPDNPVTRGQMAAFLRRAVAHAGRPAMSE
jgi:hypothetical protein